MSIQIYNHSMKKPFFWEKAKKDLALKDKRLGRIINQYPKDFLFTKSDPFYTLARSIVGQQISVKAAQAVWDRFEKKVKKEAKAKSTPSKKTETKTKSASTKIDTKVKTKTTTKK